MPSSITLCATMKSETPLTKAANVPKGLLTPNPKGRLRDQFPEVARFRHFSPRTETSYWDWVLRYLKFHRARAGEWRHPRELGGSGVTPFLTHLAVERRISTFTQNQALNALVFLYREVLHLPVEAHDFVRVKRAARLPTVLTKEEVRELLGQMEGTHLLMAQLLYGTGLRLLEMLRLRVKDVDFGRRQIAVHDGKGMNQRVTMLPERLREALSRHLERVRRLHETDLAEGLGAVMLPGSLGVKYPNAPREWPWQWVFPSAHRSVNPDTGQMGRHHTAEPDCRGR
jgi:integron integrase